MPTDLRAELAGAAGDPPTPDVHTVLRRANALRRRNRLAATSAAAVFVLAAVVGTLQTQDRPAATEAEIADSLGGSVLDLPPPGETAASQLADGAPVFVVHHADGEVSVLDAVTPHMADSRPHLVGWCASSRGFEELVHGGAYSEHGVGIAGPTGGDLTSYAFDRVSATSVLVPDPMVTDQRQRPEPTGPTDDHCSGGHGVTNWNPGTTLHHTFESTPRMSLEQALADPPDGLVVIDDGLIVAGEQTTACLDPSVLDPSDCNGPPVSGVGGSADDPHLIRADYAARISGGVIEDVIFFEGSPDPRRTREPCPDQRWVEGGC